MVDHERIHPWSHLFWRLRRHWAGKTLIFALVTWLIRHLMHDAQDRYPYGGDSP